MGFCQTKTPRRIVEYSSNSNDTTYYKYSKNGNLLEVVSKEDSSYFQYNSQNQLIKKIKKKKKVIYIETITYDSVQINVRYVQVRSWPEKKFRDSTIKYYNDTSVIKIFQYDSPLSAPIFQTDFLYDSLNRVSRINYITNGFLSRYVTKTYEGKNTILKEFKNGDTLTYKSVYIEKSKKKINKHYFYDEFEEQKEHTTYKFDRKGNIIKFEVSPNKSGWKAKFKYDKFGNWTKSESFLYGLKGSRYKEKITTYRKIIY